MPRTTATADETVTVRLPKGTADKLRAATGQKFSTLVRWMCMEMLKKYEAEGAQRLTDGHLEVREMVNGQ